MGGLWNDTMPTSGETKSSEEGDVLLTPAHAKKKYLALLKVVHDLKGEEKTKMWARIDKLQSNAYSRSAGSWSKSAAINKSLARRLPQTEPSSTPFVWEICLLLLPVLFLLYAFRRRLARLARRTARKATTDTADLEETPERFR